MFTRVVTGFVVMLAVSAWSSQMAWGQPDRAGTGPEGASHGQADTTEPAEHEGGGGDINPLDFQRDTAIWTAVVFLLLLAVLWKFAWGPIADGLGKREQRIADEIASAEKSNADARQLLEEYQKKLAASQDEVRQMIELAKHDAEKVGGQIVEKARDDAEAEHRRALEEIDLATADALKELAERSASLAVELAGKIVDARLDPNAHSRLIEQAVADFSKQQPSKN